MMHGLKMPDAFARARIQRYEAIAEKIFSNAVCAIKIIGGRTDRQVGDAPFCVYRYFTPYVGAADVFISLRWPGFISIFSRVRNGMKGPHAFSRNYIIGADMARRRKIIFTRR